MSTRVDVILHEQVVFIVTYFLSQVQIATLELRLKKQGFIRLIHLAVFKLFQLVFCL